MLPTGRRHWMRDDPATPATDLEEILASTPLDEHRRLRHGGRGARTELLCGGFALEGGSQSLVEEHPADDIYLLGIGCVRSLSSGRGLIGISGDGRWLCVVSR